MKKIVTAGSNPHGIDPQVPISIILRTSEIASEKKLGIRIVLHNEMRFNPMWLNHNGIKAKW